MDELKTHFANLSKTPGAEAQKIEMLSAQLKKSGINDITPQLLAGMGNLNLVGQIPLLQGKNTKNDAVSVTMYIDDNGKGNGYAANIRAKQLTKELMCRHEGPVYGDAFIARIYDNTDDFERRDFLLSELDSSSKWFKVGKQKNIKSLKNNNVSEFAQVLQQQKKAKQATTKKKKTKTAAPSPPVQINEAAIGKFTQGENVIIDGLKNNSAFNGQTGLIHGEYIVEKDRWPVTLVNGKVISVRTENLLKLSAVETAPELEIIEQEMETSL